MIRCLLPLLVASLSWLPLGAQKIDRKLTSQVQTLTRDFNGSVGVFVKDLRSGRTVAINADTLFPTASLIKIPILLGVMNGLETGALNWEAELVYRDSLLYEGVDILGSFKDGEKIALSKVVMLMLTMSDNTASLWLQSLSGKGERINALLDSNGFRATRVNSRTPGREGNRALYGWGQTTPFEMAAFMEKIVRGDLISRGRSRQMLRLLGRNYWDEYAIAAIPPDVFVASKGGAVNATRNEVLYVNGKGARYIFCICTKNNRDESWGNRNEAWVLTRQLSALLWTHFSKKR